MRLLGGTVFHPDDMHAYVPWVWIWLIAAVALSAWGFYRRDLGLIIAGCTAAVIATAFALLAIAARVTSLASSL